MPATHRPSNQAGDGLPPHAYAPSRGVVLECPHCAAAVPVPDPIDRYAYYETTQCPNCTTAFFLDLYAVDDWNCFRLVEEY